MSNKSLVVIGVFAVLVVGAAFFLKRMPISSQAATPFSAVTSTPSTIVPATAKSSVKEFTVTGANFSFDPKEISVKKGDTVKITFKNAEGFHDFVIDELKVNSGRIQGGSEKIVEFTADKTGEFQYYCSVGTHRANGMWGMLKVQ